MKTETIVRALRNSTSPAATLAARLNRPLFRRRQDKTPRTHTTPLELSSPEVEKSLLWLSENDREVSRSWSGREFLDHRGWFTDEYEDETMETYAVILARFPHLVFYAVKYSDNGGLRVELSEWEEIDFSECESEYDADEKRKDAAKGMIRACDSSTERDAEESREYCRKDQVKRDIEENKVELKTLRGEIMSLVRELKTLCASPLAMDYSSATRNLPKASKT